MRNHVFIPMPGDIVKESYYQDTMDGRCAGYYIRLIYLDDGVYEVVSCYGKIGNEKRITQVSKHPLPLSVAVCLFDKTEHSRSSKKGYVKACPDISKISEFSVYENGVTNPGPVPKSVRRKPIGISMKVEANADIPPISF